ncbi:hypothetical protein TorRG33x02_180860 [Trema orientale]|uniref:Uncharacterized protein n=1 Tax=Trema orientale TaxID=63057 RepID=A0A2P5EKF4_TREOI|nr:hypothetical protein TorRG33x02_180860 [Trema orientale]
MELESSSKSVEEVVPPEVEWARQRVVRQEHKSQQRVRCCSGEIHQPSNTDTTDTSTVNLSNSWSSRQIRSHGRERINGGNIHKPSNEDATDASTVNLSDSRT